MKKRAKPPSGNVRWSLRHSIKKRPPTKLKLGKPHRGRNSSRKNSQLPCERKIREEKEYSEKAAEQGKKVLDEQKTKQCSDKSGSQRDGPLGALTGD